MGFAEDFRRFFLRGLAALLPTLITLWLLILAMDAEAPWKRALPLLLLAVVAVRNAGNFRMPPVVDFHWSRYAERIERGEQVDVAIYPAGWGMTVAPRGAEVTSPR